MSFPGEGPHAVRIDRKANGARPPTAWLLVCLDGSEAAT
jgi:hypothetical protein